jgi:hypothetical protein
MAMKQTGRKQYKSMTGKVVDMDLLRQRNELTPAVGNARVNARGDELGAGGRIIKKREDVMKEYYNNNPQAVVDEQSVRPEKEAKATTTTSSTSTRKTGQTKAQAKVEEEWVEDADGNFVKKGE